ncbi:Solute Carrier Family 22 Member 3 [Manis pentadactyla]|nr:Solute Carrier Family 22 Member 3 [Manis pentadactyla]
MLISSFDFCFPDQHSSGSLPGCTSFVCPKWTGEQVQTTEPVSPFTLTQCPPERPPRWNPVCRCSMKSLHAVFWGLRD